MSNEYPKQHILNDSGHPTRLVACRADSGRPISLQVVKEGVLRLLTDRGERILYHGFEPAWDCLGFVNVELPNFLGEKVACYFNPQVTASLLEARLLCGHESYVADWTPERSIALVDATTAWNVIGCKMEGDVWAIGTVAAELTWIDDGDKPIPVSGGFNLNMATFLGENCNGGLMPFENMLWRLVMSLRRNREECSYADAFTHLEKRNEVFLSARLSHYRQLAAEYPSLGLSV